MIFDKIISVHIFDVMNAVSQELTFSVSGAAGQQ